MKKLLFIPLLFICSIAFAEPSVTSVSSDTINGLNFGTKENAAPVTYDTFTRETISTTADIGSWESTYSLTISGVSRTVGSNCGSYNFVGNAVTAGVQGINSVVSEKWFVQYWFKLADDIG